MKLTKAIHAVVDGLTIESIAGKRYDASLLLPKLIGTNAVVFNAAGMTESERKGNWRVLIPRRSSGMLRKKAEYWNSYGGEDE
jgi:hypothetical protein